MARDYEKNVIINFLGKTNIPEVTGEIDAAFGKLGNITSPFAGLADDVLAANAAITGLSAVVATKAVAAFADFQDQMLKVKGIMGASEEEYAQLTALTRELGATTRYTASAPFAVAAGAPITSIHRCPASASITANRSRGRSMRRTWPLGVLTAKVAMRRD